MPGTPDLPRRRPPGGRTAALLLALFALAAAPARAKDPPTIPPSFFGLHLLDHRRIVPDLPVGALRSWDAHPGLAWTEISPAPGQHDWRGLDAYLDRAAALGAEVVYVFGRTPRWASAKPDDTRSPYGPGQCAPPARLEDWDAFVEALLRHAAGRIEAWELWNEPQDPGFYCGDIATLTEMARRASALIRRLDPGAVIVSPSATGWDRGRAARWMDAFLARDGGDSFDVFGFHGYAPGEPEAIIDIVGQVRRLLARHGLADRPIWNTEASWAGHAGIRPEDPHRRAAYLARAYLLQGHLGVGRFYWYAYDGGRWGGLLDEAAALQPDGVAYRTLHRWLVGARLVGPCRAEGPFWRCELRQPDGATAIALWSTGREAEVAVPEGFTRYRDLADLAHPLTGTRVRVGAAPILLEQPGKARP